MDPRLGAPTPSGPVRTDPPTGSLRGLPRRGAEDINPAASGTPSRTVEDRIELSEAGKALAAREAAQNSRNAKQDLEEGSFVGRGSELQERIEALARLREEALEAERQRTERREEASRLAAGAPETEYDRSRQSRLDRLEILVAQGRFEVDPFMVDRIAIQLARYM